MSTIRYSILLATVALTTLSTSISSYITYPTLQTRRCLLTMRKGRKSLRQTIGKSKGGIATPTTTSRSPNTVPSTPIKTNWQTVKGLKSSSELPQTPNKIQLIDTMADALINSATNPTGAICIVKAKEDGKTYCFASSCTSCKIPLNKAKILPSNEETGNVDPRLACDFCSATFNVRTGEVLQRDKSSSGGNLLGGLVKGLLSAKDREPLATYELGEQNGKVLINLP